MANVLVIDDNDTLREGVAQVIRKMGHEVLTASGGAQGILLFKSNAIDFTITDLKMDHVTGMDVLRGVKELDPNALVMIITAFGTIEVAVDAMQAGAFDFITKPFPPDLLRTKVAKSLEVRAMRRDMERLEAVNQALLDDVDAKYNFNDIIGDSEAIESVFKTVRKVARTDSTAFVFGESGTGKELVARAIHNASPRSSRPFVKVNCGALAETLLESELFGHEKGSFTGAHKRKIGRFELADGGTIFLDEIGDVTPGIQLKLLRVLQEREFERVGGEDTIKVDVRVVTATNKDLSRLVEEGSFREDLYYRLHIIPLTLPPLRDRRSDVPALVDHFIRKLATRTRSEVEGISAEALSMLQAYPFPGNVRELENIIEQALVFAEGELVEVDDLPSFVSKRDRGDSLQIPQGDRTLPEILEELEHQLILRAFKKANGVKTETARILGIKTSALYYKLEKYGLDESSLE